MKIHLIYFSPGGTTQRTVRKIAEGIASNLSNCVILEYDMLDRTNRKLNFEFPKEDLVILGMMTLVQPFGPVREIFQAIRGNHTPIVGVVLYGNGMYGNSLRVMKHQVEKRGFEMIAAAAFIGQMTYDARVANKRPDEKDISLQLNFGEQISQKLIHEKKLQLRSKLKTDWPKSTIFHYLKTAFFLYAPLGSMKVPKPFNSLDFNSNCIECGLCEKRCPVGAIDLQKKQSDSKLCIGCLACVNGCKQRGINYTNRFMKKAASDCVKFFTERREPEIFL